MKKKVIAMLIATMACTAAFGFSSCNLIQSGGNSSSSSSTIDSSRDSSIDSSTIDSSTDSGNSDDSSSETPTIHTHVYGEVSYAWNEANTACTATRVCSSCDADTDGHTQTATATITSSVTQNKTCTLPELTKYTATFTEDWAETQTKENVETAAATGHSPSSDWTKDENGHWHVCTNDDCNEKADESKHTDVTITDGVCDVCGFASNNLITATVAALVGDGTNDRVDVRLTLAKNAGSDVFKAIVKGMENAKDGSVNLTIGGVETIPEEAFKSCYALGGVTLDEGVKKIGKNAFRGVRYMTSLIIGDDVTDIGEYAFSECYGLVDVTFGEKVENIGKSAFDSANKVESVVLPDSVKTLGSYTFGYCSSLTEIVLSKNIATIPTNVFYGTAIKSLTVPDGVTTLEDQAFGTCYKLESIVIPDSVTSIGENLFFTDTALKSVTFGKGITQLGGNLFYACSSLTEITFLSPITEVAGNTFYDEKAYVTELNLATANVTLNLAKGQKVLEQNNDGKWVATTTEFTGGTTFCGSTFKEVALYSAKIDATNMGLNDLQTKLTTLVAEGETRFSLTLAKDADDNTFMVIASGLANAVDGSINLTINGAETISEYSFYGCTALRSLVLSDSVENIGECAFYGCTSLTTLTIGGGVTSMESNAFRNCSALENLTIEEGVKVIGRSAFFGCSAIESVTIPDSVTTIVDSAFYNCTSLKTLTIGSGVTSMGNGAFHSCSALETLTIKEGLKVIGDYAFCDCTAIESVTIPDGMTTIGESAFYGCTALKTLTVGGVEEIGWRAFGECEKLETLTLKEGVKRIGDSVFQHCTSLKSVAIPDSVTSIGMHTFYQCTSLTTLTIGSGVEKIGEEAFYECTSLTTLTLKNGIKEIGYCAFRKCSALTSVTIPDSVTKIGEGAFSMCSNMTEMTIGAGVNELEGIVSDTSALVCLTFRAPITKAHHLLFDNINTENITLTLAKGQKILARNSGSTTYEATGELFTDGTTFCDKTFKAIVVPVEIDATEMSASDLQSELTAVINGGETALRIKLSSAADHDMFAAIRNGLKNSAAEDGTIYLIIEGVTSIPENFLGFYEDDNKNEVPAVDKLYGISLPDVTTIGAGAFVACKKLETVSAPKLTTIGDGGFSTCSSLKTIDLSCVITVGDFAFTSCGALATVNMPVATSIGEYAFSWSGLQSGTFGSLTKISAAMFMNCDELTDLAFGKAITSIESANWCELASTSQTTLTLAYGQDQITFENSDLNLNPDRNRFGDYTFKEIIISSAEEM